MSHLRALCAAGLLCALSTGCQSVPTAVASHTPGESPAPAGMSLEVRAAEQALSSIETRLAKLDPTVRAQVSEAMRELLTNCPYSRATSTLVLAIHQEAGDDRDAIKTLLERVVALHVELGVDTLPVANGGDGLAGARTDSTLSSAMWSLATVGGLSQNMPTGQHGRIEAARATLTTHLGTSWPNDAVFAGLVAASEGGPAWLTAILDLQRSLSC